jgi:hypothetical protein
LTLNTKYYVRAYAINNIGTSYGSEISFTTDLSTGDSYQGGIVFYILQTGDTGYDPGTRHGLISATFDLSSGTQWGCDGTLISGADGSAIGTGAANTNSIVTGCTTAGIASRLCYDLVIGIYSDWYLPSINELYKLYDNRAIIGGFNTTGVAYWSSTQSLEWSAWAQNFQMGNAGGTNKSNSTTLVRAIRSF